MKTTVEKLKAFNRVKLLNQAGLVVFLGAWLGVFQSWRRSTTRGGASADSKWARDTSTARSSDRARPLQLVSVTIAVVKPRLQRRGERAAQHPHSKVGKGIFDIDGDRLDKILIAKGVTTTGPFAFDRRRSLIPKRKAPP